MSKPKEARERKQAQRARQAALGIKRVEVALSTRQREQLETLRRDSQSCLVHEDEDGVAFSISAP
ncbi:hypothetical protein ACOY98_12740 [Aeromonas hydrophila]|uniref:hypothetical protein n=1 Tax=Aeromonas hydrophila TaxID=644 RepID=UPI003BEA8C43